MVIITAIRTAASIISTLTNLTQEKWICIITHVTFKSYSLNHHFDEEINLKMKCVLLIKQHRRVQGDWRYCSMHFHPQNRLKRMVGFTLVATLLQA